MIQNLEKRLDALVAKVKAKYGGFLFFGGAYLDQFTAFVKQHLDYYASHIDALTSNAATYDAVVDALIADAKKYIPLPWYLAPLSGIAFNSLAKFLKDHRQEFHDDLLASGG